MPLFPKGTDAQHRVFRDIVDERNRQDAKFGPDRDHDPFLWMTILTEEVGEVADAILAHRYCKVESDQPLRHLREELVQVAAVAVCFVECLDRGRWRYADAAGLTPDEARIAIDAIESLDVDGHSRSKADRALLAKLRVIRDGVGA